MLLGGCAGQDVKVDEVYGGYYPANSADSVASKRVGKLKTKVRAPDRAVVEGPPEPDCGAQKGQGRPETASGPESAGDPNADLAMRIKLEYERECYRQAEQRMRDRVKQLQTSKAAKSAEPSDRSAQ